MAHIKLQPVHLHLNLVAREINLRGGLTLLAKPQRFPLITNAHDIKLILQPEVFSGKAGLQTGLHGDVSKVDALRAIVLRRVKDGRL